MRGVFISPPKAERGNWLFFSSGCSCPPVCSHSLNGMMIENLFDTCLSEYFSTAPPERSHHILTPFEEIMATTTMVAAICILQSVQDVLSSLVFLLQGALYACSQSGDLFGHCFVAMEWMLVAEEALQFLLAQIPLTGVCPSVVALAPGFADEAAWQLGQCNNMNVEICLVVSGGSG